MELSYQTGECRWEVERGPLRSWGYSNSQIATDARDDLPAGRGDLLWLRVLEIPVHGW